MLACATAGKRLPGCHLQRPHLLASQRRWQGKNGEHWWMPDDDIVRRMRVSASPPVRAEVKSLTPPLRHRASLLLSVRRRSRCRTAAVPK